MDGNWGNGNGIASLMERDKFSGTSNKNDDRIGFVSTPLFDPMESNQPWTWEAGDGGPQKNDITNTYFHSRTIFNPYPVDVDNPDPLTQPGARDETWLFLATETRATNGDQHVDFEYNAAGIKMFDQGDDESTAVEVDSCVDDEGVLVGLGSVGGREINDFIVSMDYAQGGTNPIATLRRWRVDGPDGILGTADDNPDGEYLPFDSDGDGCPDDLNEIGRALLLPPRVTVPQCEDLPGGVVFTATNSQNISGPWGHFDPDGSESANAIPLQYVVVGINLTALGVFDPSVSQCAADSTVLVKSRSSDSFTAELKDLKLVSFQLKPVPACEFTNEPPAEVCPGQQNIMVSADETTGLSGVNYVWSIEPKNAGQAVGDANFDNGMKTIQGIDLKDVVINATIPADCDNGGFIVRLIVDKDGCAGTPCEVPVCVIDDEAPMLTNVPDTTAECDNIPGSTDPTAMDNCDPAPMVTGPVETTTAGSCPDNYTITRTWTATDFCGNSSMTSQDIVVSDNTDPMLVGVPADTTAECDNVPGPPNVTATDNCDPNPNVTGPVETTIPGSCPDEYTLRRTWTATDRCGNSVMASQDIAVSDNTDPMLVGVPGDTTAECDDIPAPPQVTATDNCDPDPMVSGPVEVTLPGTCPFTIRRTWTATDRCGNSVMMSQDILVNDTTDPMLVGVPADITAECDDIPDSPDPTATDNCDPNPIVTGPVETTLPGSCPDEYTLRRTWTATDACQNSVMASQDIAVSDNTDPMLVGVPADTTAECDDIPDSVDPDGDGQL